MMLASGLLLCNILLAVPASAIALNRRGQELELGQRSVDTLKVNPIRKVVTLLEKLAKKVEAEGQEEEKLYKRFSCYCKNGEADLKASISSNDAKVPALQSDIEQGESEEARLKGELKQHQADREAANIAVQEAKALRGKEHESFVEQSTELKGYIDALDKAIPAITDGMAGTRLLQTAGSVVASALHRAVASNAAITDYDRSTVVAFLSDQASSSLSNGYTPSGFEVVGILKTMKDNFDKDLAASTATEDQAQKFFEELVNAKAREVTALGASIEKKTQRLGDMQVSVVRMKQDLTQSESMLIEDQKFLNELAGSCEKKQADWNQRSQVRAEELVAIHDTIKILSEDDALDLFKKTLDSSRPSFVQLNLHSGSARLQKRALMLLNKLTTSPAFVRDPKPELQFLALALQGKKIDFSKVVLMIDNMITVLKQEQADDDSKKDYCGQQIDTVEDKGKVLQKSADDAESAIEQYTEAIESAANELKMLQAGIVELDRLVEEASSQRKAENVEFTELMSENNQAKELLNYAKNRLYKFYNPALHTTTTTAEPNFLEVESFKAIAAPGDAPETWAGNYTKKSEETQGAISMLDLLIRDLSKEMTEAQKDEEFAQKSYEQFMQESAGKRAKSVREIEIKETAKADSEVAKSVHEGDRKDLMGQLEATKIYEMQLHAECDWLVANFDLRKTARADEMDSLTQAKAILRGADFTL